MSTCGNAQIGYLVTITLLHHTERCHLLVFVLDCCNCSCVLLPSFKSHEMQSDITFQVLQQDIFSGFGDQSDCDALMCILYRIHPNTALFMYLHILPLIFWSLLPSFPWFHAPPYITADGSNLCIMHILIQTTSSLHNSTQYHKSIWKCHGSWILLIKEMQWIKKIWYVFFSTSSILNITYQIS
jgi:hypothetical protein